MTIDARLIAIYDEYLKNDKEKEFIEMLYAMLDIATQEVVADVAKKHRYEKMKATRGKNKTIRQQIEAFFANMSAEDRIAFLNTPWENQPEWIKENMKDLVRYPEEFNFLRIAGEVAKSARQKETFGARLVRYMEAHGFITSDEDGTKLHFENFSDVCNELAEKYDLARRPGHRAQRTRITTSDLKGYTTRNITPKKDKLTTIAVAMDVPVTYLGGYGSNTPPKYGPEHIPVGGGPIGGKFRKSRKSGDAA